MKRRRQHRVGYVIPDLGYGKSGSIGIRNFSLRLLELLHPSNTESIIVFCSKYAAPKISDLCGDALIVRVPFAFNNVILRVLGDHLIVPLLSLLYRIDVEFYPKGFVPLVRLGKKGRVAFIHDAIVYIHQIIYKKSDRKTLYFSWLTKNSLRRCERIITNSTYSKKMLCRINKVRSDIIVSPLGAGNVSKGNQESSPQNNDRYCLIPGSAHPHKEIRLALKCFAKAHGKINRETQIDSIYITGMKCWPSDWGQIPDDIVKMRFFGYVSDEMVDHLMRNASCVLLTSPYEGFGLPALEAYARGTPVVYRNRGGLGEILKGCPGSWDGTVGSLAQAISLVCRMKQCHIQDINQRLEQKYNWQNAARIIMRAVRSVMYEG